MSEAAGPQPGMAGEPYEFPVERGKVREFARATKARSSAYEQEPDPVVPPTFLTSSAFWATPESSPFGGAGLNWARILHGEQEYVFHGPPPRAGDVLTAQQRIEDVYTKEGRRGGTMRFTVVLTEFRAPDGRLVAEGRSTVIETSRAAGS